LASLLLPIYTLALDYMLYFLDSFARVALPMIKLNKVAKTYDGGQSFVVRDLSLEVPEGKTLVFLGSSGCGKTTTLKMINRLIEPSSGIIEVDGQNISTLDPIKLRRSIGYVFQGIGLFPHLNIADNITVVLRLLGWSRAKRLKRASELLSFVNLKPSQFASRFPHELSGGQQQRVGVARALANDPNYLLMDEPFGALDSINRDALQEEILNLKRELKKTILFVTHDVFEALRIADLIAVMDKGKLLQFGEVDEVINQPANDFVKQLFAKPAHQVSDYMAHIDG